MLNRVDAADKIDDNYAVDDLRVEFADPDLDPARDLRVWEDASGSIVAFGQLWVSQVDIGTDGSLYWRIDPAARNPGIEEDLFAWAEQRMLEAHREHGNATYLRAGVREHFTYAREVVTRQGLETIRYYYQMERDLNEPIPDLRFPPGFTLRHAQGEQDIASWVEAFNLSFIDHYNHRPLKVEAHRHWLQSPKYSAERDLIAIAPDGTFAAFCFCTIDHESNECNARGEGWIDMLGTRRGFRKIGLGRAMLLAGLQRLKADGVATAMLDVDAENPTGALDLYESVGFAVRVVSGAKPLWPSICSALA